MALIHFAQASRHCLVQFGMGCVGMWGGGGALAKLLYQNVTRSVAHYYEVFQSHECQCQLHPQAGAHMWDTPLLPPPHYSITI